MFEHETSAAPIGTRAGKVLPRHHAATSGRVEGLLALQRTVGNAAMVAHLAAVQRCGTRSGNCEDGPQSVQRQPEDDRFDHVPVTLVAAASLRPPPDWSGSVCEWLRSVIDRLLNGSADGWSTSGLKERYADMLGDKKLWATRRTGPRSWESHQQAYEQQRRGLANRLQQWRDQNCDDEGGPGLPADVFEWVNRPAPSHPAGVVPMSANQTRSSLPTWEEVAEVAVVVGLSLSVVAAILVALADPEPVSKLAAIGLTEEITTALLVRLGYAAALTGGAASTAAR
ncbi:hypothetical protein AB0J55_21950 [Amycolatopsis sp. NPDC049688]|uniref:hypothetical protein n=1 Tax=Amycolatopsis sp. NPDC049688 TaxID=3154733 RepID=UPI003416ABF4